MSPIAGCINNPNNSRNVGAVEHWEAAVLWTVVVRAWLKGCVFIFGGHILKGCVYIVLFSVDYQRESIFLKKYRNRRNIIVEKPPFVVTRTFLQRPTRICLWEQVRFNKNHRDQKQRVLIFSLSFFSLGSKLNRLVQVKSYNWKAET